MADISLLFDVLGGDSINTGSGKEINDQLTKIVEQINERPFKIKFEADGEALNRIKKAFSDLHEAIGENGVIKFDTPNLSNISKTLSAISENFKHVLAGIGNQNLQLKQIFEAIPDGGDSSVKSLKRVVSMVEELTRTIDELGGAVDEVNKKSGNTNISLFGSGAITESEERLRAYREYLHTVLREFETLQTSYNTIMSNSRAGIDLRKAFDVSAAVDSNKQLANALRTNVGSIIDNSSMMNLDELKEAAKTYTSMIGALSSIQSRGKKVFGDVGLDGIKAAREAAEHAAASVKSIDDTPADNNTGLFEYIDQIKEKIETLRDPCKSIKAEIDNAFAFDRVEVSGQSELVEKVKSICDQLGEEFDKLRVKIANTFNFSGVEIIPPDVTKTISDIADTAKNMPVGSVAGWTRGDIEGYIKSKLGSEGGARTESSLMQLGVSAEEAKKIANDLVEMGGSISGVTAETVKLADGTVNGFKVIVQATNELGDTIQNQLLYKLQEVENEAGETVKSLERVAEKERIKVNYGKKTAPRKEQESLEADMARASDAAAANARKRAEAEEETARRNEAAIQKERESAERLEKTYVSLRTAMTDVLSGSDSSLGTIPKHNADHIRDYVTNLSLLHDQWGRGELLNGAAEFKAGIESISGAFENEVLMIKRANKAEADLLREQEAVQRVEEAYKNLSTSMANALGGNDRSLGVLPEESARVIADYSAQLSNLHRQWENGEIDLAKYKSEVSRLSGEYARAVDAAKNLIAQEKAKSAQAKRGVTEENTRITLQKKLSDETTKAAKVLRDYSAAEHSKNAASREAYANIQGLIPKMDELNARIKNGDITTEEAIQLQKEYSAALSGSIAAVTKSGDAHMTAFGKIGKAIKTHLATLSATTIIGTTMREIRQMVEAVKEIDIAMTELKKVTDETDARYEKFLTDAGSRAKELSATISDTVTATADFARLGLSLDLAEKAADAAIVYRSVGDDINTIDDAAQSIISTMKAFGVEASDSMSIVDKFNEVGNRFAISSGGIGEALTRSAAAMHAANNTLDETIGLATAANTILQNPQSVGTTLKTMSMYVRAAKTELEAAGEETDGIAESTGKLRELIKQITMEGGKAVDIMADENTFKSTYQILKEISEVWENISDVNQAALLEKLGGKRNANAIAAILENFEIAEQAMETAAGSAGSAMNELSKYQESIEGHVVRLKTAFQDLSKAVVDGDLVKKAIKFGTRILDTLTGIAKLIDSLGGLKTVLLATFTVFAASSSTSNNIAVTLVRVGKVIQSVIENGFGPLKKALGGIISIIPNAVTAWNSYAAGVVSAEAAMQATIPVIAMVSAAITGFVAIISKVIQVERDRRNAAIEAGKSADAESKEIVDLYNKYIDLNEKIKEDESLKGDLEETTESLLKELGIEKGKVDELAKSYGGLSEEIAKVTIDKLKEKQIDLVAAYQAASKNLVSAETIDWDQNSANRITLIDAPNIVDKNALADLVKEGLLQGTQEFYDESSGITHTILRRDDDLSTAEGVYKAYEGLTQILERLEGTSGVSQHLVDAVRRERDQIKDQAIAYSEAAKALNDNLIQQGIIDSRNIEDLETIRAHIINVVAANRVYAGSIDDVISTVDDLLKKDERFAEFYGIQADAANKAGDASGSTLKRVESDFDKFKKTIGMLGAALGEFQERGSISSETYRNLINTDEAYKGLFTSTLNGIELQTDKLNTYIESLEQEYGEKMALNGATSEEIGMMIALGNTLVTEAQETGDVTAEIKELHSYIEKLNNGTELSYDEAEKLQKKYPKLTTAIYKAGKGYRVEIEAIEELIAIKSEYIRLTEQEMSVVQARNMLNLRNNGNITASTKIDEIFAKYQEVYGKAITSLEEFKTGYALIFDDAFEGAYEEYERYVDALITKNKSVALAAELANDALNNTGTGFDPDKIEDAAKAINDVKSELDDLTSVVKRLNEGEEFSTSETITLLNKYPALRNHIIKTANGYKIETSAIKELIAAKVNLITTTDQEKAVDAARAALVSKTNNSNTELADKWANKADVVFADFLSKNGRNIETIDEYKAAYKAYYGYAAKVTNEYAQAKIDAFAAAAEAMDPVMLDLYSDYDELYMEGYKPETSKSSSEKEETEFEKAYKTHQHYLAMDRETTEQYLNWLDGAYKASYARGEMELDDYYKYEEEIYEGRKQLFQTSIDEMQHQIDLLEHQNGDTYEEQAAIYMRMQKAVHAQADALRARGIKENDEMIRELQDQWWSYEEAIRRLRQDSFNDWLNDQKFTIDLQKKNNESTDAILQSWKTVLGSLNDELQYYLSVGYDKTSDVVQSIMKEIDDAKDEMLAVLDEVVSKANEAVDGFQNVYTTLTNAAKEYASTGYLSVDNLQSILELGPKYLDMLYDENGQLVLNEQRLQDVIAARTNELAAETALSYAKQILLATESGEIDKLRELAEVQATASGATWDMAYATLGYAKALGATKRIEESFYDNAISYVTKMQSVTQTATSSISAYYETLRDGYVSQAEGLETILKLTEDMIKQENSDRIDALEKEKDLYKDIIDEKKEILRLTKEQEAHDRDQADKLKEIATLQSKIDQLALDDSREAAAQRKKLEEELYQKQKALADDQADYAYDVQEDALDKQYEEYEKEKDKEIDEAKSYLNSAEQLYRAAVERITDAWENDWEGFYDKLLSWNYQYGNQLEKDITKAWDAATAAAERYGSFVDAMEGVKDITNLGANSVTPNSESVRSAVARGAAPIANYTNQMRANSLAWFTASDPSVYEEANRNLAAQYKQQTGTELKYNNGSWYQSGSTTPLYTLSRDEVGQAVVAAMKANSEAWHGADFTTQAQLAKMNEELAKRLSSFLGVQITKTSGGVWMLGNTPLFNVKKFHSGGVVGSGTVKQNEVMAILKKGESILDDKREEALYKAVDFVQILSDKIGRVIDRGGLSSLLSGNSISLASRANPAIAGGIGSMNFSPTVNVMISAGDGLNESTARKYGNIAADSVLEQLKNAFTQRGISTIGNGILK